MYLGVEGIDGAREGHEVVDMAHETLPRPDSGLGVQAKVLVVPFSLERGTWGLRGLMARRARGCRLFW